MDAFFWHIHLNFEPKYGRNLSFAKKGYKCITVTEKLHEDIKKEQTKQTAL